MSSKYNIYKIDSISVKKDNYVLIYGNPCKVDSISHAKTGKHGHMKVNIFATDLITNKNTNWMGMGDKKIYIFLPIRYNYQVLNVDENDIECLDNDSNIQIIKINSAEMLDEINKKIDEDKNDIYMDIMYLPIIKNNDYNNIEDYYLIHGIKSWTHMI